MFSATETDKNTRRKINRHCSGYSLFTLIYYCDLSYPILSYPIPYGTYKLFGRFYVLYPKMTEFSIDVIYVFQEIMHQCILHHHFNSHMRIVG
jgi:hypothetical protein